MESKDNKDREIPVLAKSYRQTMDNVMYNMQRVIVTLEEAKAVITRSRYERESVAGEYIREVRVMVEQMEQASTMLGDIVSGEMFTSERLKKEAEEMMFRYRTEERGVRDALENSCRMFQFSLTEGLSDQSIRAYESAINNYDEAMSMLRRMSHIASEAGGLLRKGDTYNRNNTFSETG